MLHLDTKKLARFEQPGHRVTGDRTRYTSKAGWQALHVAIDDHSRVGFSLMLADETARSACAHLLAALRYYRSLGVRIGRVMTDNGAAYKSRRFAKLLRRLKIKHIRTKPYTPHTNGKAECFIQTLLREWAFAQIVELAGAQGVGSCSRKLYARMPPAVVGLNDLHNLAFTVAPTSRKASFVWCDQVNPQDSPSVYRAPTSCSMMSGETLHFPCYIRRLPTEDGVARRLCTILYI